MTDRELQQHVQNALNWEPSVHGTEIGVSVDGAVVTLRGEVRSFAEKTAAERVALGVYGVKAVANDITVHFRDGQQRTDTEVAHAVLSALNWNALVPDEKIAITVSNGWVRLKGQVDREYQREAAAQAVRALSAVRGVTNSITVTPHVNVTDVKSKIEAALRRSAELDARRLHVIVADGKVTLSGNVHSWSERNEARRAAWAAPGVRDVEDLMAIVP